MELKHLLLGAIVVLGLLSVSEGFSPSALSHSALSPLGSSALCGFRPKGLGLRAQPLTRSAPGLRMSNTPSVDTNDEPVEEDNDEEGSTVLSDDDLEARIKELGLGEESGVQDKSTGETAQLTPMQQAQKQAVKVGTTIIGGAASGAISVLNAIETPIEEDDWKKMQEEKGVVPEEEKGPEEKTMMNSGGLAVVIPVLLVGGFLGFWAIASENDWF